MNERQALIDKLNRTGMATAEELNEIARTSGKARWTHETKSHTTYKSANGSGVIIPKSGELDRHVVAEIVKAFKYCGFLMLAGAILLKLAGVI